jgi:protein TonB
VKRHVYQPPTGRSSRIFAILGGLLATVGVFVAIPLSQRLNDIFQEPLAPPPEEISVDPPESLDFDTEQPPEEQEEEPPPEMVEEPAEVDLGLDLADLPAGAGGGFVMEIPRFSVKDAADDMMGDSLDAPPQAVAKFPPVYPPALLRSGAGGRVQVACTVDETGKVVAASIRQSSGNAELDKAAIAAVNRWKFKAATRGGKAVKASCVVPFTFEVKK